MTGSKWFLAGVYLKRSSSFKNLPTCKMSVTASTMSLSSVLADATVPEPPAEDSIKVVCRFRPLNHAEEKAGSKFVAKFTDDNCVSMGVSETEILSFDLVFLVRKIIIGGFNLFL